MSHMANSEHSLLQQLKTKQSKVNTKQMVLY